MTSRTSPLALAGLLTLLALAALPGAAVVAQKDNKEDDKKPRAAGAYATPQECFDAFIKAFARKDTKVWVAALSPEARDNAAGELAAVLAHGRAQAKKETSAEAKKEREKFRPLVAVMDRHGLTEKATASIAWDDQGQ